MQENFPHVFQVASGGKREGEDGKSHFHDLSPLIVASSEQSTGDDLSSARVRHKYKRSDFFNILQRTSHNY